MNEVRITLKNYRCFPDSNPARFISKDGLTSFVGVNNAGKSSILKFFYEFRKLLDVNFIINGFPPNGVKSFALPPETIDPQEIFYNGNDRPLEIEFELIDSAILINKDFVNKLQVTILRDGVACSRKYFNPSNLDITQCANIQQLSQIIEVLTCLENTFYVGAFRNAIHPFSQIDYNVEIVIRTLHNSYYDMNIGAKFIQEWKEFKSGKSNQNSQKAIELTSEICQVFGFNTLDISQSADERTILFTINGKRYNLSEIGSGIAQFFVVLANIAIKKPSFILIDEPEINLHPSLQIELLNILERYASNGVLYATHNVGLARHADRIYSVFRGKDNVSNIREFEKQSRLSELLGELSYSAYRELGFEKVLLVEGRTEIKVIQQFLRKYDKDNEFFVMSLGGSQYICEHSQDELREFMRTSDKIFALIDSEKKSSGQQLDSSREKFANNCNEIGIDCHILKLRATENYFPNRVLKSIKGDKCQQLEPYEKLGDRWAKSENWLFAQAMSKEELEDTDLGIFIKRICES